MKKAYCYIKTKEIKKHMKILFLDGNYLYKQLKDDELEISDEELNFNIYSQFFGIEL